ncbi:helix-turn-helix domain protein, partial [Streptococcus pneumoniae 2082170]
MQRLEVYKNYQHLYDLRIAILLNLSTLYLYNQDKNMCKQICYTLLEDAKNKKSYDRLAICYVRIGICTDDSKLIQKRVLPSGADRGNFYAVSSQKRSRDPLSTKEIIKKVEGAPRPFHRIAERFNEK